MIVYVLGENDFVHVREMTIYIILFIIQTNDCA